MKISRFYWLGLGSGFILSAMLVMTVVLLQGQVLNAMPSAVPQTLNKTLTPSTAADSKSQASAAVDLSSIERNFVIPEGSSLEWIANQLAAQGLVKNKDDFIATAYRMGVEVKFKVGTFKLSLGLTPEEIIRRLVK